MPRAPRPALRWWAQRWLDVVESQGPEFAGRLQRARIYARNAHVWRLSVRPGVLSAQVLGSYGYYTSTVKAPINSDTVWERALGPLAERPALLAGLLADDLSVDVEAILNAMDGSLFPADSASLSFACSCPDWERPCKHALAICYDFAAQCDARPALLLALTGRTVDEVMEAIRARWSAERNVSAAASAPDTGRPLRVEGYYTAGPALDSFNVPFDPPQVNGALLFQLGKPSFAGPEEDPLAPLAAFYGVMSGQALRTLARVRLLEPSAERATGDDEMVGKDGDDP